MLSKIKEHSKKRRSHHHHKDKDHHVGEGHEHGDHHEEYEEEEHHETFEKTQTDHDDEVRGMARKWDRHYYGAASLVAKCCLLAAALLGVVTGLLWSQFLYVWGFDQDIMFKMILDQNDQWSGDQMYLDFVHKDAEPQSSLFEIYLFNVSNAEIVMRDGFKPDLVEVGPYGYIKNIYRYEVSFSEHDSQFVTFKQYNYFTPTENNRDCYQMFFKMDKAIYSSQVVDCEGDDCNCRDDDEEVTVVNPAFFKMLEKWKPAGIMGLLSREIFAEYEEAFTTRFVDSVKFTFLAGFFEKIYVFRNCNYVGVTFKNLMNKIVAEHGEAQMVNWFRGSHLNDKLGYETCGELNVPTDKAAYCPFGSAQYIQSFAQSPLAQLTEREARIILGLEPAFPNTTPFGSGEEGMKRWYNTAVYLELIPPGFVSTDELEALALSSYNSLMAECHTWDGEASAVLCEFKIKGICEQMFNMWTWSLYNKEMVHVEWRDSPLNTVSCDTLGNTCGWEFDGYNDKVMSLDLITNVIDPNRAASWNYLSLYKDENMNNYYDIYTHCSAKAQGKPYQCPAMAQYEDLALTEYPQHINNTYKLSQSLPGNELSDFQEMSCQLSLWIFERWGKDNEYVKRATADWFNSRWPESDDMYKKFNSTNLKMLGYAQWGNGIPTTLLFDVPSVTNIKRDGMWRFSKKGIQLVLPEFYSRALKWAYPKMNITTFTAERVLNVLSEDSVDAFELRKNMVFKGTTFFGNGTIENGVGEKGETAFVLENAEASFLLEEDHKYYDVSVWMDQTFISNPDFCPEVENFYHRCQQQIDKFKQFWPARCSEWMTLNLDPAFGIQCNDVRIWSNSHPYPKKNGNLLESIITEVMWEETIRKGMLACENPSYVQEPMSDAFKLKCSYDKGGMFIKAKVRDILFEGYTDPFLIKVMNSDFKMRRTGYQIVCNDQVEISYTWNCEAITDPQCGESGFSVIHETDGVLANLTRNTREWYLHEIDLGSVHGIIDNPVFATYLGQLWKDSDFNTNTSDPENDEWATSQTRRNGMGGSVSAKPNFNRTENEKWQKERTCSKRYMGGPAGVFPNCTIEMETGRGELQNLGRIRNYYGNSSIELTPFTAFDVNGNFISEGAYNNFLPFVWEAFRKYDLQYKNRLEGLDYKGNKTLNVFLGDELIQFTVPNVELWDGKNPTNIKYPLRYRFFDNTTTESEVFLLRYLVDKAGWEEIGMLAHGNEFDFFGMPYEMPIGMSSTRAQSGFATTIGTPHHYGNLEWGGIDWVQFRGLRPDETKHGFRFDVEPLTGQVMRIAKRLQVNIRVERGPLMDRIISSQERCSVPTKTFNPGGYGCFMYFPLLWYDDQRVFETKATKDFQDTYLTAPGYISLNTSISVAVSVFIVGCSILAWVHQYKKWKVFKARIFLD